jgi:hypothetical protein
MDHRFSYGSNSMYISKWVRKWIRTSKSFTECLKTIRTFTLETIPGLAKTLKVHLDEKAMRCAAHAAAEAEQAGVFEKFHSAKRAKVSQQPTNNTNFFTFRLFFLIFTFSSINPPPGYSRRLPRPQ